MPTFTRSQIAAMSPAEYAENRDAIFEASNKHEIEDDGGKITQKPFDEMIKEIEANGDQVYQPAGKVYFKTSDIGNMTSKEYRENGILEAYREGRIIEDTKPEPLKPNPEGLTHMVEGGGSVQTPAWAREVNREVDAKQAEAAAKIEADKTVAERYLESIGRKSVEAE